MKSKPVLVIMAAGMGSRYGGLKQIDPVDEWGNLIIDFSIYDAVAAGFEKVIFIIKKEIEKDFKEHIGNRMEKHVKVSYVYQELDKMPEGYECPKGRVKPWGTGHAVLCCAQEIGDAAFAVINADDYYGKSGFKIMFEQLSRMGDDDRYHYAMVGYDLYKTLTDYGHVARGVCALDEKGMLQDIHERTRIERHGETAEFTEDDGKSWEQLPEETVVSMNLWGFTPSILKELKDRFAGFLDGNLKSNPLKCEYFLPFVVDELLREGKADVKVLRSSDNWYGVTYKEDKEKVIEAVKSLKKNGVYPEQLWKRGKMNYQAVAEGACERIEEVVGRFCVKGEPSECRRYGNGHINDTFLLRTEGREQGEKGCAYILQRMNTNVFKNPKGLMQNVSGVTSFLREKILNAGGDADRETLTLIKTVDGKDCYVDGIGSWWRMYLFIEDATGYDVVENEGDFYQSAKAFGHFQRLLEDYPVEKLTETIPDFHNTPKRFEAFCKAVEEDVCGRAENVRTEIAFVMAREDEMSIVVDKLKNREIPYRVTHNDTKLNNILLDNQSREALCVIDLDTIMPGTSVFDYGDSIRFGANTAAEDEEDLSKVSLSIPLFQVYTKGFLEGCAGSLTEEEVRLLPWGAKLMTLECGMRFLTDYLEGDKYFRIHRPDHNLDRARVQFALVADMERKWEKMEKLLNLEV